jgi:aminopeptidase-like protein
MPIPSHSKDTVDLIEADGSIGEQMYSYVSEMFPICRSITGNGVRETLKIIQGLLPLQIHEVPSGTKVFDWEVPKEWNIQSAYIKNSKGEKVLDFANCNLHVLNYSIPVHKKISLQELQPHLFYLQDHPDWIPYRTSYYKEDWGFCISYNQFLTLEDDTYEVFIDSTLVKGHLTYGEYYIPGETSDEVLISAHICHPSLANDNLSGISVSTFLARHLQTKKTRYSYRFLFIPGTIGAITWLAVNEPRAAGIKHGLVLSLLGDTGNFTYKKSRQDTSEIDHIVEYVLKSRDLANKIIDFVPYGYDERQFCSPGFNLAVGCLSRTTYGQYIQYHTSADNLNFIGPKQLAESLQTTIEIVETLERNQKFINLNPKCEPQLGKRELYNLKGGDNEAKEFQMALLWTLNLSDGRYSTLDIAKRSGIHFKFIAEAVNRLLDCKLLEKAN